jgi:CheY-like chemotaxis protein/anti-sigma regulatory factor (Ser/Thr protein kinase)
LEADHTRIAQVFANLLNNAAKYTERGGDIRLVARCEEQTAVVSVSDTGIGIPTDMLQRVFEMFTQANCLQQRSSGGLGVGLGLVKRIVEMHGGEVEARSKGPGMGSQFIVRLPVATSPPSADHLPARSSNQQSEARRILVADDNQNAAKLLAMCLAAQGNVVRIAFDGLAAVRIAAEFRPEVALLDIGMPQLDGYETARRIRKEPWGKEIVLAALTGWGQEDDKRRARDAGFDHHFVKPVEPSVLQQLLDNS